MTSSCLGFRSRLRCFVVARSVHLMDDDAGLLTSWSRDNPKLGFDDTVSAVKAEWTKSVYVEGLGLTCSRGLCSLLLQDALAGSTCDLTSANGRGFWRLPAFRLPEHFNAGRVLTADATCGQRSALLVHVPRSHLVSQYPQSPIELWLPSSAHIFVSFLHSHGVVCLFPFRLPSSSSTNSTKGCSFN